MKCENCGTDNLNGSITCRKCGHSFIKYIECPKCKSKIKKGTDCLICNPKNDSITNKLLLDDGKGSRGSLLFSLFATPFTVISMSLSTILSAADSLGSLGGINSGIPPVIYIIVPLVNVILYIFSIFRYPRSFYCIFITVLIIFFIIRVIIN